MSNYLILDSREILTECCKGLLQCEEAIKRSSSAFRFTDDTLVVYANSLLGLYCNWLLEQTKCFRIECGLLDIEVNLQYRGTDAITAENKARGIANISNGWHIDDPYLRTICTLSGDTTLYLDEDDKSNPITRKDQFRKSHLGTIKSVPLGHTMIFGGLHCRENSVHRKDIKFFEKPLLHKSPNKKAGRRFLVAGF